MPTELQLFPQLGEHFVGGTLAPIHQWSPMLIVDTNPDDVYTVERADQTI